jgi:riboflavin synthase
LFTGLVQALGTVEALERTPAGVRLRLSASLPGGLHDGDSVAVDGVCLTATEAQDHGFSAEVMNETLARSALGSLSTGDVVNLELPLRASDRLGGHIVQGHVDGVGTVTGASEDGFARRVEIEAPDEVMRYVVAKGSIAVNGVSLTVAALDGRSFTVSLIPETLDRTNLGRVQPGVSVNLEVDVLAKYVEKAVRG